MSTPAGEYDYISLSELPPMEASKRDGEQGLNLKATELRLGLPGSESPDRVDPGFLSLKSGHAMSGKKRGFSDAIKASGKWVFSSGSDSGHVGPNLTDKQETRLAAPVPEKKPSCALGVSPASKAQVVGWPPVHSFRKNTMATHCQKKGEEDDGDSEAKSGEGCLFVKVSMKGAPYLRKIDLNNYKSYAELSSALEKMSSCFNIGQCGNDGLNKGGLTNILHRSECVLTYEDKDGDWMLVGDVPWPMFKDTCTRLRIMKSSEAIGLGARTRGVDKCKSRD